MTPLACLIAALWFEGQEFYKTPDAIMAIADVIQNRVADDRFPSDVCGVVFQDKQFSFTHDGKPDTPIAGDEIQRRALAVILDVADRSMAGERLGITSTHYHTAASLPFWASSLHKDGTIGTHIFYTWE